MIAQFIKAHGYWRIKPSSGSKKILGTIRPRDWSYWLHRDREEPIDLGENRERAIEKAERILSR